MGYILAIDQGTTSSRAVVFDEDMTVVTIAQEEFPQHFPKPGWVEHRPDDLWTTTLTTCREALKRAGISASDINAIGITNQRETTLIWDRTTGEPIHNAIVWQDRRTADLCHKLKSDGHEDLVRSRTGLLLDPYFSATKVKWLLDNVPDARARAQAGELLFGTVDSYLIWKLTGGARHVTDATNAARTMLYDIHARDWSADICAVLDIPQNMLPEVLDCAADFGETQSDLLGARVPIRGVAGDQQAATIGQACFETGMLKATYGTGCFALLNTGDTPVASEHGLLTTIAYQLDGKVTYALEGSIFVAGAAVQWLRDGLKIIPDAAATQEMAEQSDADQPIILVPAFTGLGAPYWEPEALGAIYGLTRNSGPEDFARAALESVGYQTRDLLEAMYKDMGEHPEKAMLRVDGGLSASQWAMQFVSDITDAPIDRPKSLETTALGAAWLAGSAVGMYPDQTGAAAAWRRDRQFSPSMTPQTRDRKYAAWKAAIAATLTHAKS
ncbi:glycerol kinase GlpK [Celeribacter arenosi]|uniref:Glycerol kinase n=1 Tax=Celeribacter arenosi TaxID=792649 RepID=A0ABP7KB58_9RHOB